MYIWISNKKTDTYFEVCLDQYCYGFLKPRNSLNQHTLALPTSLQHLTSVLPQFFTGLLSGLYIPVLAHHQSILHIFVFNKGKFLKIKIESSPCHTFEIIPWYSIPPREILQASSLSPAYLSSFIVQLVSSCGLWTRHLHALIHINGLNCPME